MHVVTGCQAGVARRTQTVGQQDARLTSCGHQQTRWQGGRRFDPAGIGLARAPVGLLQVCDSPAVLHTFLQCDTLP